MLIPLAFALGIGLGYILWGNKPAEAAAATAGQNQAAAQPAGTQQAPKRYDIPVDDDPSIGPADAPITMVEFSDYECPFCRKWHVEVFPRIMQDYEGKIRFVYRDFPLTSIHDNAAPAAEAANCAGAQGKYWDYSNKLFSMELGLDASAFKQYADNLGLDGAQFSQCLKDRPYREEVQADFDFAADLGIQSTPTFFINGLAVVGAQPYETFKQIIDMELAGEIP